MLKIGKTHIYVRRAKQIKSTKSIKMLLLQRVSQQYTCKEDFAILQKNLLVNALIIQNNVGNDVKNRNITRKSKLFKKRLMFNH